MVDLLDNFLNPLKLLMALASDFTKSLITENGRGQERKINGGPATANQVRDGWKDLKHKYLQKESAIKNVFITHPLRRA
jgi:hypothetical protein